MNVREVDRCDVANDSIGRGDLQANSIHWGAATSNIEPVRVSSEASLTVQSTNPDNGELFEKIWANPHKGQIEQGGTTATVESVPQTPAMDTGHIFG